MFGDNRNDKAWEKPHCTTPNKWQCGFPFSSPFSPHGLARYPHKNIVG